MITPDERAEIMNTINEMFENKKMPYEVCGYEDDVFFCVLIDTKESEEE